MTPHRPLPSPAPSAIVAFHASVRALCVERLRDALEPRTRLFERQLRDGRWAGTLGTEALTSTAICLVGLHRAAVDPGAVGLDPAASLDALAAAARSARYPGALGLVLWANAVWGGAPLDALAARAGVDPGRLAAEAGRLTTMETAWLVSGLAHEHARSGDGRARAALGAARAELLGRATPSGLFGHASPRAPLAHRVRRWAPNFADQIYSVQALSFLAVAGRDPEALAAANAGARRIVALQGPLGQWWWHYAARRGEVLSPYPVYSVHQHAMAPMALLALGAAGGETFAAALDRSYAWLSRNELGVEMVDRAAGTIWRDLAPARGAGGRLVKDARALLGVRSPEADAVPPTLRVNRETRPYEWAWCLYAGAIAAGAERAGHAV